ncbi:MAG: T9SS C-terminal target domain-containing protein [Bacteroidetes bacterium]|nr:MAG: T9SS C-terminal target domain-containing protein [Bacteroidota bacterium]
MTTLCDGEYNTGLRCYEDPDFGFIQYVDYPCDTTYVYTSVKEAEKYVSFSVFPSLTDGVVHIQLEDANDGLRLVEIVHLSGQIIEAFSFAPNDEKQQLDINLKGYPSGGYWVRVRSEKGTGVRKVFKK